MLFRVLEVGEEREDQQGNQEQRSELLWTPVNISTFNTEPRSFFSYKRNVCVY